MDFSEYNALGEILHTSWGKSSSKTGLFSVKGRFVGENQVKLIYTTIINLVSDRELDLMKRKYSEESDDIIKQAVFIPFVQVAQVGLEALPPQRAGMLSR